VKTNLAFLAALLPAQPGYFSVVDDQKIITIEPENEAASDSWSAKPLKRLAGTTLAGAPR